MLSNMFSKILILILGLLALSFSSRASVPSPQASVDLICHNDQAECYPRVFQPTETFQVVHDDQDLPPGLHVRLDITTGKKEAKINVVEEDDQALLTTAMDVVVVDSDTEMPSLDLGHSQKHTQKPPKFNKQGAIRPPPVDTPEGTIFESSIAYVKDSALRDRKVVNFILERLEDLSHDIYYGLKLVEDSEVVLKLFGLIKANGTEADIKGASLLVLGTAIQNNPAAFTAALGHFYNDETPTGPMEAIIVALVHEQLPQLLTRFIYLLSALCQDQAHLWKFINADGLDILMTVYDHKNAGIDEKEKLRVKIENFILDHFLQQDSFRVQETQKAQSSGIEVTSELEPQDPWVLATAYAQEYEWPVPTNVQPKYKNMAQALQSWCSAFSSRIGVSTEQRINGSVVERPEQEHEAYDALEAKLKAMGCTCWKSCDFPEPKNEL
jgi:nucleotide exchange factor SIL1